jgi:hypothetical protein
MNDLVVRVDLRDPEVRGRVLRSAPGAELGRLYANLQEGGSRLTALPLRAIVVIEVSNRSDPELEAVALGLLGGDPTPNVLVAMVPPTRDPAAGLIEHRLLPAELTRFPGVRFLELRSNLVCIGHPRTGASHVPSGASPAWAQAFELDLLGRLEERPVFDAVWAMVPSDRPAAVGMRIAGLGEGRDLAVADLCLRLADELAVDHEPKTGRVLPERWTVDPRLLPAQPPYAAISRAPVIPPSLRNLFRTTSEPLTTVLRRTPNRYNEAADAAMSAARSGGFGDRPRQLAALFDGAEAASGPNEGPIISAVGAAALDHALGDNVVFGDEFARSFEAGDDAAHRVEELLRVAAERQADGLSASILASRLRADADRIAPRGPRAVAEELLSPDRPWSRGSQPVSQGEVIAAPGSLSWTTDRLGIGNHSTDHQASTTSAEGTNAGEARAGISGLRDPGHVPSGLNVFAGSPIWRNRWLLGAFLATLIGLTALRLVLLAADWAGVALLPPPGAFGLSPSLADSLAFVATVLLVIGWIYAIASLLAASAIRSWAGEFGFEVVPDALAHLEEEARAKAIAEVARGALRREMALKLRAAAATLEHGCTVGAETARKKGELVQKIGAPAAGSHRNGRSKEADVPPHRELLTRGPAVAGTDASGLYRLYPLYVNALRTIFSQALVDAIRELWPRVRGKFAEETSGMIADGAAMALDRRLDQVRVAGLRRGDLLRDGADPAEELARALWSDPLIRESARRALSFGPSDPMPILASTIDMRLLDDTKDSNLILAVPSSLESLVADEAGAKYQILVEDLLESATALRIFPFKAGIYDVLPYSDSVMVPDGGAEMPLLVAVK